MTQNFHSEIIWNFDWKLLFKPYGRKNVKCAGCYILTQNTSQPQDKYKAALTVWIRNAECHQAVGFKQHISVNSAIFSGTM
jgi:hypothetical protein